MANYTGNGSFRMWCSINLPDYATTDSYRDLLRKTVSMLSDKLSETTRISEEVNSLLDVYNAIVGANANFPNNTNLQARIYNLLDRYAVNDLNELLTTPMQKIINESEEQ